MYTASTWRHHQCEGPSSAGRIRILTAFAITLEAVFLPLFVLGCFDGSDNKGELIPLTDVLEVVVGEFHSCALRRDGTVVCWGNNTYGQLGTEAEQDSFASMDPVGIIDEKIRGYSSHATKIKGLSGVRHIAAGANHNCALLSDRSVRCWGDSSSGQLGNGEFSLDACEGRPCSRTPVQVEGLENVVDLVLGQRHSCAIHQNGELSCWGSDVVGFASGLKSCDQEPCATIPKKVPLMRDVIQVMSGYNHACALLAGGAVVCWGENSLGQLGVSNPPYETIHDVSILSDLQQPSEVSLAGPAERILQQGSSTAFKDKSCVELQNGSLYCWGKNDWGQLGVGNQTEQSCWTGPNSSTACSTYPMKVAIEGEIETVVLAENTGCAITVDGRLYCWGRADSAQLGADAEIEDECHSGKLCSTTPVFIPTEAPIVDVALGLRYTCALRRDDEIDCWGWGFRSASQDLSKQIDCSSSLDACSVERHFSGKPKDLVMTHFDILCVLTQEGEVHCLQNFAVSRRTIQSAPLRVYR